MMHVTLGHRPVAKRMKRLGCEKVQSKPVHGAECLKHTVLMVSY